MSILTALEQYPVLFYTFVILLALIVGSFVNVVIHRLPIMLQQVWKQDCLEFLSEKFPGQIHSATLTSTEKKKNYNLVVPRSACPKCGHMITAIENIPVISYLFLKGRCKNCSEPISIRYPFIEVLSAALILVVAIDFGVSMQALFAAILTWALLCLAVIDIDTLYLPDQITLPFLWLGILLNINSMFVDLTSAVIGAIAGYLILWTVYHVFKFVTRKEGMGYGDFKLLAMLGAWLGWQMLPVIILISSIVGTIIGLLMIAIKKSEKGKPIPFGPYMAGAGWVVLIWGQELNDIYFRLFIV